MKAVELCLRVCVRVCRSICESDDCVGSSVTAVTDQGGMFLPYGYGGGSMGEPSLSYLKSFISTPHSPIAEREQSEWHLITQLLITWQAL